MQTTYTLAYGMTGSYVTATQTCENSVLSTSAAAAAAAAASPVSAASLGLVLEPQNPSQHV